MSLSDVLVVLQARMGSQRLPGKSLMPLAGQSLLAHCVTRLTRSAPGRVVVATSSLHEDDLLADEAASLGTLVHRGPWDDVLERMRGAAELSTATFIVRATGDNPAVDPDSIDRLLVAIQAEGCDHVVEDGLPYGSTVEVMTAKALRCAAARARNSSDREHVTPYIRNAANGFRSVLVPAPSALQRPDLRFTVDTRDDLDYMERVFGAARPEDGPYRSLATLVAAADVVAAFGVGAA